jgi:hypothetical protein
MAQSKLDLLNKIKQVSIDIASIEKDSAKSQEDRNKLIEAQERKAKRLGAEIKKINKEQLEATKGIVSSIGEQEQGLKSLTGILTPIKDIEERRVKALGESNIASQHNIDTLSKAQSINEKIANLTSTDIVQRQALNMELEQELGSLKGRGAALDRQKSLLMDSNKLANQYAGLTEKQRAFLEKQHAVYDGIKDTIGGILETASLLTSTVGGVLGGALIGAGVAGKKLLDTSYQLGGSLLDTSNISTTLFGTVFEDAVGTTKSLSKEFGGLSDVSLTTQYRTNVIAKNLGIGASEAASLTGQFARLNDGSAETAQNLIQSTKNLAEQNGLVPADVMADVANSAEAFALFGKDGGKNIAEAAVAAGKLGVSMSQISGIADNLLDFESSINAELQLGAMLGKNINLDKARALAYEGDLGGMVRETLSSLGGIDEFNKMDVFAKREVANLLGVSADEFQKMATNADKLGKDGKIIPTQYEKLANSAKAFGSQIFSGIQGLGSMAVAAGQMGFSLKDGLSSMKGMGGLGGKIGKIFSKGGGGPLTKAGKPDMRFNSNKGLGKMSKGGGMGGMMKGMGAGMKGMASGFAAFANPATLLGLAAITAGIIGIGYALRIAAPGIESLGKAIGSIVESIGTAVKTIIGGLGDFFMKVSSVATPELALSVLGLAGGFYALTGSLAAFAIAGIAAIPAMLAVSAFGAASGLLDLGGDSGGGSGDSDLINEIRGLRDDLINGKVGVYLDGKKVTAGVARVSNASSFNVYSN